MKLMVNLWKSNWFLWLAEDHFMYFYFGLTNWDVSLGLFKGIENIVLHWWDIYVLGDVGLFYALVEWDAV